MLAYRGLERIGLSIANEQVSLIAGLALTSKSVVDCPTQKSAPNQTGVGNVVVD
jgi:hypothetical protein